MTELFADQDRLDDLLKEVPKELTAKLRQVRQTQAKIVRQIPTLERKRADAEKLTEQIRNVLGDLRQLAENGTEQLEAQIDSVGEAVEAAAQALSSDAESIVAEVDGVEGAADTLRTTLGEVSSRTGAAAQSATAGLSSFEENARTAMAGLQKAGDDVQTGTEALARAVDEAQETVASAVEGLRQRMDELLSSASESAASGVQSFGQLADQHRASLDGLGGRLSGWTTETAESTRQRLAGEVEEPVKEKLEEIPGLIEELESVLTDLGEEARIAGDQSASGFASLRDRARSAKGLVEQVLQLAETLNA